MTEFISRSYGNKEFEVIIKTDSKEHYKQTEDFARKLIDHAKPQTNADRIRAWNDHELAETIANFVSDIDNGDVRYSDNPNDWLEWLQKPAEVE